MQFVSALSVSRLEEAFRLVSMNNTEKIKQGEKMLQQFQTQTDYFTLLSTYLSSQNQNFDNRLRAILQLKQFMRSEVAIQFIERQSSIIMGYLFQFYLIFQQKLAKYLIQIMVDNFSGCAEQVYGQLVQRTYENEEKKARMFKFMKAWFQSDYGDEFKYEHISEILKYLLDQMQIALNNNSSSLLKYRIMKVMHILLLQQQQFLDSKQANTIEVVSKLTIFLLNAPDPQVDQKYSIKLKICAMKCLLAVFNLSLLQGQNMVQVCQFSGDIWTRYINKPKYTVYCLEYLKTLADLHVYQILFKDQTQLKEAIQRVFVLILGFIYNEEKFYLRLKDDAQDFITACIINSEHQPIRLEAINTVKSLAFAYPSIWFQTVKAGIASPHIANQLLCFVVDSYGFISNSQIRQQIQTSALQMYNKRIRNHFFELYGKVIDPKQTITQKQLFDFVIQIRLISVFMKIFQPSELKIIAILSSKLAVVSQLVAPVCFNFINYLFKKMKKIKFSPQDIATIYIQAINNMLLNEQNVSNRDIFLIETGLLQIKQHKEFADQLKQPVKNIIMLLIKRLQQYKQYDMMDITFSIMHYYMNDVGFEPQFQPIILYWMKENLFTQYLVKCYVKYLTNYCQDTTSAQSLFLEMSKPSFWMQNKSNGKINAFLYSFLVKHLPLNSQYRLHIIPNFFQILKDMLNPDLNPMNFQNAIQVHYVIQYIFIELNALIIQGKHENQFYNIVTDNSSFLFNKGKDATLFKMIQKSLPTDLYTFQKVGLQLLNSRKIRINDQNISACFKLLFQISKILLIQQGLQLEQRNKIQSLWSNQLRSLMDYFYHNQKQNKQPLRKQFAMLVTQFINQTKINIGQLFKEKMQIKLSGLITNSFK